MKTAQSGIPTITADSITKGDTSDVPFRRPRSHLFQESVLESPCLRCISAQLGRHRWLVAVRKAEVCRIERQRISVHAAVCCNRNFLQEWRCLLASNLSRWSMLRIALGGLKELLCKASPHVFLIIPLCFERVPNAIINSARGAVTSECFQAVGKTISVVVTPRAYLSLPSAS